MCEPSPLMPQIRLLTRRGGYGRVALSVAGLLLAGLCSFSIGAWAVAIKVSELLFIFNKTEILLNNCGIAFLGNTRALAGFVKGVSGVMDSATMSEACHFLMAQARAGQY